MGSILMLPRSNFFAMGFRTRRKPVKRRDFLCSLFGPNHVSRNSSMLNCCSTVLAFATRVSLVATTVSFVSPTGRIHCLFWTWLFILGRETSLGCFAEVADGMRHLNWLRCRCGLSCLCGTWPLGCRELCILDRIDVSLAHLG